MNKGSNFFKSFLPFVIAIILQIAATAVLYIVYLVIQIFSGLEISQAASYLAELSSDQSFTQLVNITYGLLTAVICGIWYHRVFVKPARGRMSNHPSGFSFHTIISLLFLGIGLQYMCALLMDIIELLRPVWIENYSSMISSAGYTDASLILIIYTVLVAPIAEETVFRGLVYRFARRALPFWIANIWQALLFGVIHLNIAQGIYAFAIGLVFGWLCHRGHGIKYSITAHIIFNIFGCFFSELFTMTTALYYNIFMAIGAALTIFSIWLFYTDFRAAR